MIDLSVVALYLLITLFAGIYNRSTATTLSGYIKLGKDLSNNTFILMATIFASAVGGGTTFGITEKAYSSDLAFSYGLLLAVPIDLLIAKYLAPKLSRYRHVTSIGEIVSAHYGITPRIITGFAASLISIGYLSAQISVSGIIFSFLLNIDYVYGILFSYGVVIFYTSFGGLRSIVINNNIQFMAMILAIPALTIAGLHHIGISEFIRITPSAKYNFIDNSTLSTNIAYAAISFSVMGFYPTLIQRILAGKSAEKITRAIYFKSALYVFFVICISLNGLLASIIVPESAPQYSLIALINEIIPAGLRGFILVGLLASVMSTADSDLNVASISIVNDIIKPLSKPDSWFHKSHNLIMIAKLLSIFIGSSSILLVMNFKSVVDIVIFAAGLWAPIAAIPLIGILYGVVISDLGFCICALAGSLTFLVTEHIYTDPKMSGVFLGTIASLLVFLMFRFVSPKPTSLSIESSD